MSIKGITHSVESLNKRPPTEIETLRKNMSNGEFIEAVENYFKGDKTEALRFKTAAVDYVRKVPKLLECDRISLLTALVQVAQFRFLPSGASGEAYIIPYGKEAKFQLGYQGIVTLLWRTGKVKSISANIVYSNERFEYTEGIDMHLEHVPTKFGEKKGEPIGVYVVVKTTEGGVVFKVMSKEDVMAIKNLSKAKNAAESPWNSDKDPELWMWKKTCLIQTAKLLPKTAELQQAIEADNEGEGIEKPHFDAGGPAVGAAFHNPKDFETVKPDNDLPVIKVDAEEYQGE